VVPRLGLLSGVGLVVANMVGAGVFLSAGFMSQELFPGEILAAWAIGAVLALCGTISYSALANAVPRSGGEYRYLSALLHPFLGYVAGWASLLVGFAGPIAVDAHAAGAFAAKLWPGLDPNRFGAVLILGLVAFHALDMRVSKSAQNAFVALKVTLLFAFIVLGLTYGSRELPATVPPSRASDFPVGAFVTSLFFIAYAFSGWNAAVYSSEEFRDPKRDVVRSMLIGCGSVGVAYLLVNFVLLANVTPESAAVVFRYESERLTLAHVVIERLFGLRMANVASAALALALFSAASAMMFVGPRVYAAMAADGFLPSWLVAKRGRPPVVAVLLQGAVALLILYTHRVQEVLQNVGAILTLFSALTAFAVFKLRSRRPGESPSRLAVAAAVVYTASAAFMIVMALRQSPTLWVWALSFVAIAGVIYALTRRADRNAPAPRD